jgi:hypothetical protein
MELAALVINSRRYSRRDSAPVKVNAIRRPSNPKTIVSTGPDPEESVFIPVRIAFALINLPTSKKTSINIISPIKDNTSIDSILILFLIPDYIG